MSGNTFGTLFKVTTFGESHGPGLGCVVDGCPPHLSLDETIIQKELDRRKPGQGYGATARKEDDLVMIQSGVFEGKTTGTPIGLYIANSDHRSADYGTIKDTFRPGHGDYTYQAKYGIRDYRGGGRSSGRETVSRVAAGAIAQAYLHTQGISVLACTTELGSIPATAFEPKNILDRPFFAADSAVVPLWEKRIDEVRKQRDTLGGIVRIVATGVPAGLGEPVFDKLDARLAAALMSVGAVKGVEIGSGFAAARLLGSENNDQLTPQGFTSNHAGGILAGISSGQELIVTAAIKPIPSISQKQNTVDVHGTPRTIAIGGRHDICAIPRVVPVLKAMVCLTLVDMLLVQNSRS